MQEFLQCLERLVKGNGPLPSATEFFSYTQNNVIPKQYVPYITQILVNLMHASSVMVMLSSLEKNANPNTDLVHKIKSVLNMAREMLRSSATRCRRMISKELPEEAESLFNQFLSIQQTMDNEAVPSEWVRFAWRHMYYLGSMISHFMKTKARWVESPTEENEAAVEAASAALLLTTPAQWPEAPDAFCDLCRSFIYGDDPLPAVIEFFDTHIVTGC